MRGRKPKATALKLLAGNPGCRKINDEEPMPQVGIGDPPSWLKSRAAKKWREVRAALDATGALTVADRDALASYCQTYARMVELERKSKLAVDDRKEWATLKDLHLLVLKFASEFGLTPASRTRVRTGKKTEPKAAKARFFDKHG